ncbi:RND family efflux transporter MFP subunit [Paraburkholderia sp. GAS41]|jgi:RND family efflux transporter MFP subunit|uniref:efflux RND transporter periplasmic adaptor subunit n=1 Tax=Paraburkholderia sp. GAS41 TaxID=3035134 RepID=UPI003D2026B7
MSSDSVFPVDAPSRRPLKLAGVIGLLIVLGIVAAGLTLRVVDARKLKTWTDAQAVQTVTLIQPIHDANGPSLQLPGRLEAYTRAPIFAQVGGYLKSWNVDIGTRVKAGQPLAEIDTPELDQQLVQARADLQSAEANALVAGTTAKRWEALRGTDSVAQQDVDQRTADYTARAALAAAAKANVDRLVATKAFARIVAPFDGVVTARDIDVGALVSAGSGGTGRELFEVSEVKQLRVYVQVPQNYAPAIHDGTTASLSVPEYPDQQFTARVVAAADSVNSNSGTTLVQLLVDNANGKLLPGGFASLKFTLPVAANAIRVPASALVIDSRGVLVATLGANGQVQFKHVKIDRDLGDSVEIGAGLAATDRVIDTPPDGLVDGDRVQVATAADRKAAAHG